MKTAQVLVVGSSNTDMILRLPSIPRAGETLIGGRFFMASGGKGANQAVAAARCGGSVTFLACLGDDLFGRQAIEGFRKEGIETKHIKVIESVPSGVALIFVDNNGENSIGVSSGANARLTPKDIDTAAPLIDSSTVVLLQLETPLETVERVVEIAYQKDATIILNPAPAQEIPESLLEKLTILTPNASEAGQLARINVSDRLSGEKAARKLVRMGVRCVIVTLGKDGVLLCEGETCTHFAAFNIAKVIDTTSAGDTFNGALAVALSESMPLTEAIRFANMAAAITVTRLGAQPAIPNRKEIEHGLSRS